MMKRIILITISFSLLFTISSCNSWLDVKPKTQVEEEDMFDSEEGFQDALIGTYVYMKNDNAYGEKLTLTTIEYMAQHWDPSMNTYEQYLCIYDYNNVNVRNAINAIYGQMYATIAQANNILESIDVKQDVFTGVNYELIKGEALGIRAYIHFDLLRLFGPIPLYGDGTTPILPYVKSLTKEVLLHTNYNDYVTQLENDIKEAMRLLEEIDPYVFGDHSYASNWNDKLNEIGDDFLYRRKQRMNYYALKGLLARLYLWKGDKTNAGILAKELIEAKNWNGDNLFPLGGKEDVDTSGDKVMTCEHLFSMHVYNLSDKYDILFGNFNPLNKNQTLVYSNVFDDNSNDLRYVSMWQNITLMNGSMKFILTKYDQTKFSSQVVPLIRISEMYLIAEESEIGGDIDYLDELRRRRGVSQIDMDDAQRYEEITKEYRREFYGEGQMFFYYKRNNVERVLWSSLIMTRESYELPLPDGELVYN